VSTNLAEEPAEGVRDDFFDTASEEVEKGRDGVFAGLTNPIDKFIRYFTNRGKKRFELYLARSGKYGDMMRGILAKYGLPEDLIYLALIESGFSPKAYSTAKAAGPWQFIAGTGRRYGLRIDWWTDERRDAEKSTHAAASYLKDLYGMFDSWPLAAAAYNAGEGKISRAVNRYKSDDFAVLIRHGYLKQETKDYVPKMLAAMTIAREPEKYGFEDIEYEAPLDLKKVMVPGGTDLMETARILEVPYDDIRDWNPELRRFCTPPTLDEYELRLSTGAASLAEERIGDIRARAKVTFLQHNVRKKETLSGLSEKYGTSPAILKELNGLKGDSLRSVSRLVIPVTGLSGEEALPGKEIAPDQLTMAHLRVEEERRKGRSRTASSGQAANEGAVRVRKGDTLGRIAKRYGVSAEELARVNDLDPSAKVKAGRRLVLPDGASQPAKDRKKVVRYTVHRGDTLDTIAREYGVKPDVLAECNRLRQGELPRLGSVLVIPRES
jgi:membrane-bound lytic murein transglycosylase D